ncbi:MAG: fructose-bisphosphate aldolase [Acidimicrobiales bacterium]|nr:fructose-bisphosphate aldolase [Acidimicrobiales bacterium]
MAKLQLDDIADLRAYERERDDFRRTVIDVKKKRRIHVGPVVTLLFENRDTIRFQVQEMARAERILTDEGIQTELDVYNPMIPEPGNLAATLFIELTSEDQLREWLPKLVGIERSIELRIGGADGAAPRVVRCVVDAEHEKQLTREDTTASVHYVHFSLDAADVEAFAAGPVTLASSHPAYPHEARLPDETRYELLGDLRG